MSSDHSTATPWTPPTPRDEPSSPPSLQDPNPTPKDTANQYDRVYQEVRRICDYEKLTIGKFLHLLIDRWEATDAMQTPTTGEQNALPIHVHYAGVRVCGIYYPTSRAVTITDGPLAGRRFKSSTGARRAVIELLRPEVNSNGNGWLFWTLTDSGQKLDTLRERPRPRV